MNVLEEGEDDPRPFNLRVKMKSQNGICGVRLPLCRPTLTRFALRQYFLFSYILIIDECSINLIL